MSKVLHRLSFLFLATGSLWMSAASLGAENSDLVSHAEPKRALFVRGDAAQFAGGAMIGVPLVQLNWDVALSDRIWLGPYLGFGSGGEGRTDVGIFGWGAQTGLMLNGSLQDSGWYIRAIWNELKVTARTSTSKAEAHVHLLGAIFGYRWLWESGFNLALGIGPVHAQGDGDLGVKMAGVDVGNAPVSSEAWIPYPEFTLGFSF